MTPHRHSVSHRDVGIGGSLLALVLALTTAACSSSGKSGGPTDSGPITTAASPADGSGSDPSTFTSDGTNSFGGGAAAAAKLWRLYLGVGWHQQQRWFSGCLGISWQP